MCCGDVIEGEDIVETVADGAVCFAKKRCSRAHWVAFMMLAHYGLTIAGLVVESITLRDMYKAHDAASKSTSISPKYACSYDNGCLFATWSDADIINVWLSLLIVWAVIAVPTYTILILYVFFFRMERCRDLCCKKYEDGGCCCPRAYANGGTHHHTNQPCEIIIHVFNVVEGILIEVLTI